jgi:hypothetical protein
VAEVTRLWNPRGHDTLRRYWAAFDGQIIIEGWLPEHTGMLTLRTDGPECLRARLHMLGGEYEEIVASGEDLIIRIHGLILHVGIKAVAARRLLLAFRVPNGSPPGVKLTLDEGRSTWDAASDFAAAPALRHDFPT